MPYPIDKFGSASGASTSATLTATVPATAQVGDILMLVAAGYASPTFSASIAGGGGSVGQIGTTISDATNGHSASLFGRYLVSTDIGAVLTLTAGGGAGNLAMEGVILRGMPSGLTLTALAPTPVQTTDTTRDATATIGGITTAAANSIVLAFLGWGDNSAASTPATFAAHAGMTVLGQQKSAGTGGKNHGAAIAWLQQATAAATGALNGTFSGGTSGTAFNYAFTVAFAPRASTTFYVDSATGADTNTGLSTGTAWRTHGKVAAQVLVAGDSVLFNGGLSYSGTTLSWDNTTWTGTEASPITFSTYGVGVATLVTTSAASGFFLYNVAGLAMSNLAFVGPGAGVLKNGIEFYADTAGGVKYAGITIQDVEVSNYGRIGITIGGFANKPDLTGFKNVTLRRVHVHDNIVGFLSYGQDNLGGCAHQNFTIESCEFNNNTGIAGGPTFLSGSGVAISSVDTATIQFNRFHHNCQNNTLGAGPSGFISFECTGLTIQVNESDHNIVFAGGDGDGFDIDYATQNSVCQYNYSHDNSGSGYVFAHLTGYLPHTGNVIRYNISENDGHGPGATIAGVFIYNSGAVGAMTGNTLHNNTVVTPQNGTNNAYAFWQESNVTNLHVYNNIFMAGGTAGLVNGTSGNVGVVFKNNILFSIAGGSTLSWGNITHTGDITADPQLSGYGSQSTIGVVPANPGASVTQYQLTGASPAIDAGIDGNAVYGVSMGSRDFFGGSIPFGGLYDIGADELNTSAARWIFPDRRRRVAAFVAAGGAGGGALQSPRD